ncbi:MAG: translesion DNA synthesis-associated protein ImuA [Hydrogenophaga sp.]|uniref:translesion DNA synthesis-associated protein ImuA n=1 Tax=Hydrogenophaga sp. TaxID=1904254 RepID=UPI0027189CF5|nr:translesion DNA synthesis-associated protein ImuA [Hydrogenophaga sp.]MDO9033501.1 translesion DNA synthesis-associated protein ImuA [Hydrogenophaga sp.]
MPSPAPARLPDPPLARPAHNAPRPVPAPGALSSALPAAVAAALWRADQLGSPVAATWSSGFEALDAALPGGGWPGHGVTELLSAQSGTLEWRLLGPLLRQVCATGRSVVLVGPPRPPHPPGLRLDGIAEQQLVWVMAETPAERLWSTEQLVKANACGALIAWLPQVRPEQVRRLQVLAAGCAGPVFLCRPATAARESSAAPLRLLARVGADWELLVDVFKRKGPPLETTLHLPSVPGGLQAILTPRLQKPSTLLPLEPAPQTALLPLTLPSETGHALVSTPAAGTRRHRLAH